MNERIIGQPQGLLPQLEYMNYYILMADIIGSSQQNGQELMIAFKRIVERINVNSKARILSPLTITLGDEFQGILRSLSDAIAVIIELEETMIQYGFPIRLRYVLHYGAIDTPINTTMAYGMLGQGLTDARMFLSALKKDRECRFQITLPNDKYLEEKLNLAFLNYQKFIDSWKPKDYPIVYPLIQEMHYRKVAEKVGKDPSQIWKRRRTLEIREYLAMRRLILLEVLKC